MICAVTFNAIALLTGSGCKCGFIICAADQVSRIDGKLAAVCFNMVSQGCGTTRNHFCQQAGWVYAFIAVPGIRS